MLLIDGYKCGHRQQYPNGTQFVYSNFTPRNSRNPEIKEIVFFGLQYFIKEYLINQWNENFFDRNKEDVVNEYKRYIDNYLGKDTIPIDHIEDLYDLGYLPIKIKALPEGSLVPIGIPVLTIINTKLEFFWLTNYLETLISNIIWKPITSATTAYQYRKKFDEYVEKTGYDKSFVQWQGHDFSFRGMSGNEDALLSGAGHTLSFTGSDTIPVIWFMEKYYNVDSDKDLIIGSVFATEHSVMMAAGNNNEFETFKRLITEVYPSGIVAIVSDTWDLWTVLTGFLPRLKNEIEARDGRVVIRPDSGNPVDIICGESIGLKGTPQDKGAYELLWDVFGGTINEKGFKELNPKVGLIYGDSITLERQDQILKRLEAKGFSASNLVLGIGSFTYEYVTRDTFGFAMKATWCQVNGEEREIFKDPITDNGIKKSAKGLLQVYEENNKYKLKDCCTKEEEDFGVLEVVFEDGILFKDYSLSEIRCKLNNLLICR